MNREDLRLETEDERRVEELVFPGSHSDVGGLYEDNHAIADVTLDWILEPTIERGLKPSILRLQLQTTTTKSTTR